MYIHTQINTNTYGMIDVRVQFALRVCMLIAMAADAHCDCRSVANRVL